MTIQTVKRGKAWLFPRHRFFLVVRTLIFLNKGLSRGFSLFQWMAVGTRCFCTPGRLMHQCNRRRIGSDFLYRFTMLRCKINTLLSSWRVDWGFLFFLDDARL